MSTRTHLNYRTSNFATYLTEKSHSFGSLHSTMQILKRHTKDTHLNTIKRFYIYAEYINNNHLNDEHTITLNRIFEILLKTNIHPPPKPHPQTPLITVTRTHRPNDWPTPNKVNALKHNSTW